MGKAFVKGYTHLKSNWEKERLEKPDKMLLAHYFRFALRMNTSIENLRGKPGAVLELLVMSYHVGRALKKDPIVNNTALIRLRKAIRFIEVSLSSLHLSVL